MKTTITKIFGFIMIITFVSCSDGDPGPAGSAGPQGQAGATGATGPQGEKGDPGTANVIYSAWMDVEWNGINDPEYKTMKIEEPLLTSEFLDKGGVTLFFIRAVEDDVTVVLPTPYQLGNVHLFGAAQIVSGVSSVGLVASSTDGSTISESMFAGLEVRYVLIPGGTLTTGGRIDLSYESVKSQYNIPD
jgi:hypothetical protein